MQYRLACTAHQASVVYLDYLDSYHDDESLCLIDVEGFFDGLECKTLFFVCFGYGTSSSFR